MRPRFSFFDLQPIHINRPTPARYFEICARRFEFLDVAPRRLFGTFPIRGSPARISSQARNAASSKSAASAGSTCQPVTFFLNNRIDRMFGNSRRKLSWCSCVVASHTPLSAFFFGRSRRISTIFSPTYTARHPNIGFVLGDSGESASSTNSYGTILCCFTLKNVSSGATTEFLLRSFAIAPMTQPSYSQFSVRPSFGPAVPRVLPQ
jgi:hypothetical protein